MIIVKLQRFTMVAEFRHQYSLSLLIVPNLDNGNEVIVRPEALF